MKGALRERHIKNPLTRWRNFAIGSPRSSIRYKFVVNRARPLDDDPWDRKKARENSPSAEKKNRLSHSANARI